MDSVSRDISDRLRICRIYFLGILSNTYRNNVFNNFSSWILKIILNINLVFLYVCYIQCLDVELLKIIFPYFKLIKWVLVGFVFLPFVWIVNSIWFFPDAFLRPTSNEKKKFRLCKLISLLFLTFLIDVSLSLIGALIWIIGLTAWNVVYHQNRISWGFLGDRLSFNIPPGEL